MCKKALSRKKTRTFKSQHYVAFSRENMNSVATKSAK